MAFVIIASLSVLVLAACGSNGIVIPTKAVDPTPTAPPSDIGPDEVWSTTPGPGGGFTTFRPCAALYKYELEAKLKGADMDTYLLRRTREAANDWETSPEDIDRWRTNCYEYSPPTPRP